MQHPRGFSHLSTVRLWSMLGALLWATESASDALAHLLSLPMHLGLNLCFCGQCRDSVEEVAHSHDDQKNPTSHNLQNVRT